jgi:sialate O-acetylesterase
VASGQSNMEFSVSAAANAKTAIAAARDSMIREFKIPNSWSFASDSDLAGGGWLPADSQHVASFSAVAYFFATHLRPTVGVPIGIVNATWGGSNIETWISRGAQKLTDSAWFALQSAVANHDAVIRDSLRMLLGSLPTVDSGLVGGAAAWADPSFDDRSWRDIAVPSYWESQGFPGLDGVAWYRTSFTLTQSEVANGASISLTAVDDDDITWVNGIEVGRTNGYSARRQYRVPASALRPGANVLAVRVVVGGGGGGINGDASLTLAGGTTRSLAGKWKFKIGLVSIHEDGQWINKIPTILYNKMIHPITPLPIKGVIWYQGESNSNSDQQAIAYREQFRALITSWRKEWNGGRSAFPFLWVQLPAYGKPDATPPLHAGWALQRESMDSALSLPITGRAVTIDLGEGDNLHPRDKEDVGARLALVARRVAYNERVEDSGPRYKSFALLGDTVVVSFTHVGAGFRGPSDAVGGFAIAGVDKQFVWANAKIVGDQIYAWSDRVRSPVAIRYGWANNPEHARVVSRDGLPLSPFRTDSW